MTKKKSNKKATKVAEPPKDRLTKEQYQEMQINFLRRDQLKERLQTLALTIESHERAKQLAVLQRNDTKAQIQRVELDHKAFMDRLLKKEGIDIKGKIIDPETYQIIKT